jgi:hypothetical protein
MADWDDSRWSFPERTDKKEPVKTEVRPGGWQDCFTADAVEATIFFRASDGKF